MATNIQIQNAPMSGRVLRRPQHTFQIRQRPFQIQPFLLAPVIPGETMKNFLFQARVVTDPIVNPLVGWWCEYYVFYVKHRDLDDRATLTSMHLDLTTSVTALKHATGDAPYYVHDDGMDWSRLCLKRVVEEYFRDQGEAWNTWLIDTLPVAAINNKSWLDSVTDNTAIPDQADDDDTPASEMETMLRTWEFMRANKLSNMSFEDFLATHGVRSSSIIEPHKPELLRYFRDWQYPSNTIDPSTGAPSSAVSWAMAERSDKDRFFSEPGFIFGVCVVRPKVYLASQTGSAAGLLDNALAWLPAILKDDPTSSLVKKATSEGPLQSTTNPYWVDLRDIFIHGDQFINFSLSETDASLVALPTAALNKKYVTGTMADALFKSASPANKIRMDGLVSLSILGAQVDQT